MRTSSGTGSSFQQVPKRRPTDGLETADTIRILIATDNHVGYNERDAIRGDDSWRSFDEAMSVARERDVDMILLAGDLFHDNKPSRKSMYQVMRSLRTNCLGDKPCELEMLGDGSEHFTGCVLDLKHGAAFVISSTENQQGFQPRQLRRSQHQRCDPGLLHPWQP
jgi:hypothetical protein